MLHTFLTEASKSLSAVFKCARYHIIVLFACMVDNLDTIYCSHSLVSLSHIKYTAFTASSSFSFSQYYSSYRNQISLYTSKHSFVICVRAGFQKCKRNVPSSMSFEIAGLPAMIYSSLTCLRNFRFLPFFLTDVWSLLKQNDNFVQRTLREENCVRSIDGRPLKTFVVPMKVCAHNALAR